MQGVVESVLPCLIEATDLDLHSSRALHQPESAQLLLMMHVLCFVSFLSRSCIFVYNY
jgi:hypothetical protein